MINARLAIKTDSKDIFEWRNDEFTRKMSHRTDIVEWSGHCKWFSSYLASQNRLLVLCEDVETSSKVAAIHFDIEGDAAIVSINISPKVRGRGLAKICLSESILFFKSKFPFVQLITAEIKFINTVSSRAFESVGFVLKFETKEIKIYNYVFKK
jgi:UDP-2,4-diacetamido-2,4,6-trideoxy-beta-L-altropyranose hydrolase